MYPDWEFQLCSHNNFALFSRLSHFKKQNKYKYFFRLLSRFIASQIRKMQLFAASVERIKCFLSSILIKMWESLRSLCKVLKKTMQKVYAKIVKNILPLSSISAICPCRNNSQGSCPKHMKEHTNHWTKVIGGWCVALSLEMKLPVCPSVSWSEGWSVCHNLLKGTEVSLPMLVSEQMLFTPGAIANHFIR